MKSTTRVFGAASFCREDDKTVRKTICKPTLPALSPYRQFFKRNHYPFLGSVVLILILTGCMHPPKKFTEKRLVVASNQTVSISELGMTIHNDGCGRKWISEDDKPAFERPFCDITVKYKDSTYHFGGSFDPLYITNLKLVIDKMNPWGREEDSIPAGGCRIIVSRLDDLSR